MFFVYVLSGLFLGWSLGANDAANVYGTAVGTRMVSFRSAALVCSVFVLIGAVFGGAGASHTLGKLGAVNALPGSFTVSLAAALTVAWMTKLKLPVSTSQAVVGAIIGWNLFSGANTDMTSLSKIVGAWVLCPVLAGGFTIVLFKLWQRGARGVNLHLLRADAITRYGLMVVGALASYSLGANNIANVMGVFVPAVPFGPLDLFGVLTLDPAQQLFLLGALAIGVGVFTYSKKVMLTVGNDLFKLSPSAALIVVLAQAIVLFLFSSEELENWLAVHGLPTIPLVPVSSSQAVIGAVIGIGIAKGAHNIRFRVLGRIASGWISTPILAGALSFVLLFIVQNVFSQLVYRPVRHELSYDVAVKLTEQGLYFEDLDRLLNQRFDNARAIKQALTAIAPAGTDVARLISYTELTPMQIDIELLEPHWDYRWYSEEQVTAVFRLNGRRFSYAWQLDDALAAITPAWRFRPRSVANKLYNKDLWQKLDYLHTLFDEAARSPARDGSGGL